MAHVVRLQVLDFRNLQSVVIEPTAQFNIFYGQNGAGKTSILEALYYLGFGRSFRTNNLSSLIHRESRRFSLYAELQATDNIVPVGIERDLESNRRIRFNGNNIKTIAPVAELFPIQLISTDSHRFFHDGPKARRQFINWGLFHVEPNFFPLWQRLFQILKQRNAALKARVPKAELVIWDNEFVEISEKINKLQQKYVNQLQHYLVNLTSTVFDFSRLRFDYYPGWNQASSLEQALNKNYFKDQALGYTSSGPHRADLQLLLDGISAVEVLSQGQQKLVSYALYLAQGQLVRTISNKTPIYLIDDLPSELDSDSRSYIASILTELNAQVFITGITLEELRDAITLTNAQLFHVEQNSARRVSA